MLARLLARVARRLRVLVPEAVVVAEVGRVVLEAAAVVAVGPFRALERLDLSRVCFSQIWKFKVWFWCKNFDRKLRRLEPRTTDEQRTTRYHFPCLTDANYVDVTS